MYAIHSFPTNDTFSGFRCIPTGESECQLCSHQCRESFTPNVEYRVGSEWRNERNSSIPLWWLCRIRKISHYLALVSQSTLWKSTARRLLRISVHTFVWFLVSVAVIFVVGES